MREKIETVLLGLEKIARETGEDEYELIFSLAFEKGIIITEEISSLLFYNHISVWILKPFVKEEFEASRSAWISRYPSHLVDINLQKIEKNRRLYIKYPENIEIYRIYDDLFDVLTEEHGIECDDINEAEWKEIKDTDIWKSSVFQTARELVAFRMKKYS